MLCTMSLCGRDLLSSFRSIYSADVLSYLLVPDAICVPVILSGPAIY